MLVRLADRLQRQEEHRQIGGNASDGALEIAFVDERVDADRQVRPVLFDRRHRQHGDDFAHVGGVKIAPGHLRPEFRRQHHFLPGPSSGARGDRLDFHLEFRAREALHDHQGGGGRRIADKFVTHLHVAAQIFGRRHEGVDPHDIAQATCRLRRGWRRWRESTAAPAPRLPPERRRPGRSPAGPNRRRAGFPARSPRRGNNARTADGSNWETKGASRRLIAKTGLPLARPCRRVEARLTVAPKLLRDGATVVAAWERS